LEFAYTSSGTWEPPISYSPTIYYGNLDTFLGAASVIFPSGVSGWENNPKSPNVYSLTLGIQQDVGFGTVAEVKYVGTLIRNLQASRALNTVPYGARFLNRDPAYPNNPNAYLSDNFFRPLPGFSSVSYTETSASSNYHSLQATANRRFARGFDFSASWVWSKMMDYSGLPMYRPRRVW